MLILVSSVMIAWGASAQALQADPQELIRTYVEAWNEADAAKRMRLLEQVWAADGAYTDPLGRADGRETLSRRIGERIQKSPGERIALTSAVDIHHGLVRFTWRSIEADGSVRMEGVNFGELTPDGQIKRMVGFFGSPKPL